MPIIKINNIAEQFEAPDPTVEALALKKLLPEKGTAIALNGRLVKREDWATTRLEDNDNVMIISAAYGG